MNRCNYQNRELLEDGINYTMSLRDSWYNNQNMGGILDLFDRDMFPQDINWHSWFQKDINYQGN